MSKKTLNLATDAWIPIRRRDGTLESIAPADMTSQIEANPVVQTAWPRGDLDAGCLELLIGMLIAALQPKTEADWRRRWRDPPAPAELNEAFGKIAKDFDLFYADGGGFLQSREPIEGGRHEASTTLLLNSAPKAAENKNTGMMAGHANPQDVLSLPAAAMALYVFQTFAQQGGGGHYTSIRGGGPLSTLPAAEHPTLGWTLWGLLWPSAETLAQMKTRGGERTRRKANGSLHPWNAPIPEGWTTPSMVHPLHEYWAMPRRLRLITTENEGRCALLGTVSSPVVQAVHVAVRGVHYESDWPHPLSGGYAKPDERVRPRHGPPMPFMLSAATGLAGPDERYKRVPAPVLTAFQLRRKECSKVKTLVHGYAFDYKRAIAWHQLEIANMPLDRKRARTLTSWMNRVRDLVEDGGALVVEAVRATASDGKAPGGVNARTAYRGRMRDRMLELTAKAAGAITVAPENEQEQVARTLARTALVETVRQMMATFDETCPFPLDNAKRARYHARSRHFLVLNCEGRTEKGRRLYSTAGLGLEPVDENEKGAQTHQRTQLEPDSTEKTLSRWWASLKRPDPRPGERAAKRISRLRRTTTLKEAAGNEEIRRLAGRLPEHPIERVAAAALALAEATADERRTLPRIVGGNQERPASIERRRMQLLIDGEWEDHVTALRAAAKAAGRRFNVGTTGRDLVTWTLQVRYAWTALYEQALAAARQPGVPERLIAATPPTRKTKRDAA